MARYRVKAGCHRLAPEHRHQVRRKAFKQQHIDIGAPGDRNRSGHFVGRRSAGRRRLAGGLAYGLGEEGGGIRIVEKAVAGAEIRLMAG